MPRGPHEAREMYRRAHNPRKERKVEEDGSSSAVGCLEGSRGMREWRKCCRGASLSSG